MIWTFLKSIKHKYFRVNHHKNEVTQLYYYYLSPTIIIITFTLLYILQTSPVQFLIKYSTDNNTKNTQLRTTQKQKGLG